MVTRVPPPTGPLLGLMVVTDGGLDRAPAVRWPPITPTGSAPAATATHLKNSLIISPPKSVRQPGDRWSQSFGRRGPKGRRRDRSLPLRLANESPDRGGRTPPPKWTFTRRTFRSAEASRKICYVWVGWVESPGLAGA